MIEDYPLSNPNYHSATDTSDTIDLDLCANITRAAAAALVELASD